MTANKIAGRCWSSYKPSPGMICANPEGEMELPVGTELNCTCSNCAPVTIKCESKGSAKQWEYDGICEKRVKCTGNSPSDMECPGMDTNVTAVFQDMRQCNCKHNCMPINITCDSTGQWNYSRTPCITSDSFPPTALIEFGEHILTSFENNELKFQCKSGYELTGNSIVKCINGTRKANVPKCEEASAISIIIICMLIFGFLAILIIILCYRKHTTKLNISTANSMKTEENYQPRPGISNFPTMDRAEDNHQNTRPLPPLEKTSSVEYDEIITPNPRQQSQTRMKPTSPTLSSEYAVPVGANTNSEYAVVVMKDQAKENYSIPIYSQVVKYQTKENESNDIYSQVVKIQTINRR
ncbi:hypothetical protein B566_EDAN004951 [Ephemera danica]|nr:hypothetical protein B566_EDAN004951 [Ephemera danica]